jgi:FkbM family methyltransferase
MSVLKQVTKNLLWGIQRPFRGSDYWPVKVRSGPAKDSWLNLDLRVNGAYYLGKYDNWIFDKLNINRWLKSGDTAWDCGSYVGYYAAAFRNVTGDQGFVEVFEASSKNYQPLKDLPKLNHWDNVRIHNLAIGPSHSKIEFAGELGGSSGPANLSKTFAKNVSREVVPCSGVDEAILERGIRVPRFIKFDLETAEEFALHNGHVMFTQHRPVILLELHGEKVLSPVAEFFSQYDYLGWNILQFDQPEETPLTDLISLKQRLTSNTIVCLPIEVNRFN